MQVWHRGTKGVLEAVPSLRGKLRVQHSGSSLGILGSHPWVSEFRGAGSGSSAPRHPSRQELLSFC